MARMAGLDQRVGSCGTPLSSACAGNGKTARLGRGRAKQQKPIFGFISHHFIQDLGPECSQAALIREAVDLWKLKLKVLQP
jgi:hypothetical protein